MESQLTRTDVEAMINTAIAAALSSIGADRANIEPASNVSGRKAINPLANKYTFVDSSPYGSPEMGSFSRSTRSREERGVKEPKETPAGTPKTPPVPIPKPGGVLGGGERGTTMGSGQAISDPIGGHRAAGAGGGLGVATGGRSKEALAEQAKESAAKVKEKAKDDQALAEKADALMREATGREPSPETLRAISKTAEGMAKTYVTKEGLQNELDGFLQRIGAKGGAYPLFLQQELGGGYVWGPGGGAGGVGGITDDYCFVGTTKVTIPQTGKTDFLKITLGASPSASWVAAMVDTQASNSVVFEVNKNRIYLSGEFGG